MYVCMYVCVLKYGYFHSRYYAKRCFLALAENISKHMLILKDSSMDEILGNDNLSFIDVQSEDVLVIVELVVAGVVGVGTDCSW